MPRAGPSGAGSPPGASGLDRREEDKLRQARKKQNRFFRPGVPARESRARNGPDTGPRGPSPQAERQPGRKNERNAALNA